MILREIVRKYETNSKHDPMIFVRAFPEIVRNIDKYPYEKSNNLPWFAGNEASKYLSIVVWDTVLENKKVVFFNSLKESNNMFSYNFYLPTQQTEHDGTFDGQPTVRYPRAHYFIQKYLYVDSLFLCALTFFAYVMTATFLISSIISRSFPVNFFKFTGFGGILSFCLGQCAYLLFGYYESARYTLPLLPFLYAGFTFLLVKSASPLNLHEKVQPASI
jgi:hypothetical protein